METATKPRDIPFAKNVSKLVDSLNELSLPTDTSTPFLSTGFIPKLSKEQQKHLITKCPNSTFESSTPRKQRSVSFIFHEESEDDQSEVDDQDDNFDDSYDVSTSPIQEKFYVDALEEYTINIFGCDLSSDILVSFMDRDIEMRDLFICNQEFFDLVKQCIFGTSEEGWQQFLEILYSPRHILLDAEWMSIISETLNPNPPLLAKFKEIVGYCEVDDDDNASISNMEEEHDYDDYYDDYCYYYDDEDDLNIPYSSSSSSHNSYTIGDANLGESFLDVSVIRDFPKILENLEASYPQFFLNVRQFLSRRTEYRGSALGGNHLSQTRRSSRGSRNVFQEGNTNDNELSSSWRRYLPTTSSPLKPTNLSSKTPTLYDEFKSVLLTPRSEMSDEEWEVAIYEYLDPWPQLAAQFEEIISYEIAEDCSC